MKEYTAYHVVTERPMTVGQVLCLDETYPSGVYRRVMEKVPMVEEIYQNPGAWAGKPLEHHTMVALRELALEQVRREQFPQHPSRLHCLYVSETREEAQQWASFFASLGRPTYHIVKLQVRGRKFVGNANLCFDATVNQEENRRLAQRYWSLALDPAGQPPHLGDFGGRGDTGGGNCRRDWEKPVKWVADRYSKCEWINLKTRTPGLRFSPYKARERAPRGIKVLCLLSFQKQASGFIKLKARAARERIPPEFRA